MIAVVVGVPGVGKTTVIEEARKHVNVDVVNYGDLFFEAAKEVYGINERDEIRRKLTADQYRILHEKASDRLLELAKKPIVLDTHALIAVKTGFMPGFPKFVLQKLPISLFIIVEADPREIAERRTLDKGRKRGGDLESDIETHQLLNRAAVVNYAIEKGASVYIVKNKEGKVEEVGRKVAEVLREWISGLGY
jgi:adenylate kinase